MKIKTKLLITFMSAIILPLIMTLSFFSIYFSYKTRDSKFEKIDINKSVTEFAMRVSYYYPHISDYSVFDEEIKNELKPYTSIIEYVEIINLKGTIIYSSKDFERLGRNMDLNSLIAHSNDISNYSFSKKDSDFYLKIIKPMVFNSSAQGFILFKQNPYSIIESTKQIAYPILWFGIGSIMLVIIFFSRLISRGIIIPLKELSNATCEISSGNLDFKISYRKGDELGALCTAFEIMRDKLKESLIKQTEYENSRKELVASISHDLRTPLTSIKGYVEGLQDGIVKDPVKFKKYLEVIYNKTESMNKLIDDLFEYSRFDLNNITMNMQKTECRDMIEKIANNLKYDIEKEKIVFVTSIEFESFFIRADKLRIEEVINNLVSNALCYTRTLIELRAFTLNGSIVVSVSDNGCGIKASDKPRVFERFYRGEKSRSPSTGGAGLGLAIAKKIVEAHFGSMWVESKEGEGSTFFFSISGIS